MEESARKIYQLIKENKGLTLDDITELSQAKDVAALDAAIKKMIETGYITFYDGRLYPNIWTVALVPKGERQAAAEIVLQDVTIDDLKEVIVPYEGDLLLLESYPIEENNKDFFEKKADIVFDYTQFDYYLLSGFDNLDD